MTDYPHPGRVMQTEFLEPLGLSQYVLAVSIDVPRSRISEIVHGKRRIEADTAIRLSRFFGNSAQFWLNLQNQYDLRRLQGKGTYKHIKPLAA